MRSRRLAIRPSPTTTPEEARASPATRNLRIAYVAYHFPPLGGAGTQRSLKFVQNLPAFGIDPIVVTGPAERLEGRWTPKDESLLSDLPASIDVRRISGPEPCGSDGWAARRERWLLTPSQWDRWWQDAIATTLESIDGLDAIHVSMSPFGGACAVDRTARRLGLPWVAGLRDPWALDEMMAYPTSLHRRLELRRMRRSLVGAAAVVMSAPEAARRVASAFPELSGRVVAIPNGYDAADFARPVPPRDDGKFRIVHTGYLHTEETGNGYAAALRRRLGGELYGVDVSTRTHLHLLEAIRRVVSADPGLDRMLELHLAGVLSPADRSAAAGCDFVRFLGYLPHAASLDLIRTANLLFLPMQKLQPGVRAGIVPGKTYEYIATGRPILAAVPEGDARDIVRSVGTGLVCEPDDVAAMVDIIRREIDRWRAGSPPDDVDSEYLARFERRALAGQLADVLRRVTVESRSRGRVG